MKKTSGSLLQYQKAVPNGNIANFESFRFKARIRRTTADGNTKNVEVVVPLKYLNTF